jgi:PAS domain S-box-containing protein
MKTDNRNAPRLAYGGDNTDALIRRALNDISDGFFVLDSGWRFVFINNAAFQRMAGSFNTEDVIGKVIWDVAPQLVGTKFEDAYRRAMSERRTVHIEAQAGRDDRWYEVHAFPSEEALSVAFQDVTEAKRAEQLLSETIIHEKKHEERREFLAEATTLLTATLDYRETLHRLTRLTVPRMADWCAVYMENEQGQLHVVDVAHADPDKISLALDVSRRFPPRDGETGVYAVHRNSRTEWVREITDEMLKASMEDAEHLQIIRELGLRSMVMVPLVARETRLGVMAFIYAESGRLYDEDDVAFAEDLASRAAIAADNARLFGEAQHARSEAERRVREESALRKATEAVAATFSVEEVIRAIATSALEASSADGSFVERLHPGEAVVRVVARAGEMAPVEGAAIPFEGSLAQYVLETGQTQLIRVLGQSEHPLPGVLAETYATSSALAVPLIDAGEAIGALVLLRHPENGPFTEDEAERAHAFGNLAALAFRKVHLLEASEQRSREVEQVMESRSRLMRGFTHDLKNPLGAADGHAALLEDGFLGELTEKQLASITRIRTSIRNAVNLIDDLVELARAESGQVVLKAQPVDVREIVRELVEQYRPAAQQAGLNITGTLNAVEIVTSDSDRVRQVLGNLLSNAVKYTKEGGSVEVSTSQRRTQDGPDGRECVVIDVADTGLGIPEDKLDALFTEFARIDPMVKPGAGLGLAISRRIARLLGGDVTVQTARGKGSTFTLWLPHQSQA